MAQTGRRTEQASSDAGLSGRDRNVKGKNVWLCWGNFCFLITNQPKNMFHKAVHLYLRFGIFIRNTLIHPTWILASERAGMKEATPLPSGVRWWM